MENRPQRGDGGRVVEEVVEGAKGGFEWLRTGTTLSEVGALTHTHSPGPTPQHGRGRKMARASYAPLQSASFFCATTPAQYVHTPTHTSNASVLFSAKNYLTLSIAPALPSFLQPQNASNPSGASTFGACLPMVTRFLAGGRLFAKACVCVCVYAMTWRAVNSPRGRREIASKQMAAAALPFWPQQQHNKTRSRWCTVMHG